MTVIVQGPRKNPKAKNNVDSVQIDISNYPEEPGKVRDEVISTNQGTIEVDYVPQAP
ncbi:hypothetical protein ACES2L_01075 [Bdellovibrio bacteriovorus]